MAHLQRILYVEDEADIRAVARVALQVVGGFTLELCADGAEALRVAAGFAPDMILLDVMMPGMDGPSTLEALRAVPSLADVPVAFMTAKVQPDEIAYFKSLGALGVIPKPFDAMHLAQRVRTMWSDR
jgi:two-component system, OmpR family, response regulator